MKQQKWYAKEEKGFHGVARTWDINISVILSANLGSYVFTNGCEKRMSVIRLKQKQKCSMLLKHNSNAANLHIKHTMRDTITSDDDTIRIFIAAPNFCNNSVKNAIKT